MKLAREFGMEILYKHKMDLNMKVESPLVA